MSAPPNISAALASLKIPQKQPHIQRRIRPRRPADPAHPPKLRLHSFPRAPICAFIPTL